jgi:hypothetical protein
MPATRIALPFSVLRLVLPADGEVLGFNLKKNRWPGNAGKGPFEQHQRVELAFGWILRARQEDRKHERPNPPGIVDRTDYIEFHAGWRAHKAIPGIADYFDGTCSGHLRFQEQAGALTARVSNLKIQWNGGALGSIAEALPFDPEQYLQQMAQNRINDFLTKEVRADLSSLLAKYPPLARLRERARLTAQGSSLAIEVQTD